MKIKFFTFMIIALAVFAYLLYDFYYGKNIAEFTRAVMVSTS